LRLAAAFASGFSPGFTLVELALVLIAVGLLAGGLLAGYEAIERAKVKSTVAGLEALSQGTRAFYDRYQGLPGDISNALSSVPGCSSVTYCANGDGDGTLGDRIGDDEDVEATRHAAENIQFWKQLALAGYIGGVEPGAATGAAHVAFGVTHPAAGIGGGWNAVMTGRQENNRKEKSGGPDLAFALSLAPGKTSRPALRPALAARIDTLLDDGRPGSGAVTAGAPRAGCENAAANAYVTTNDAPACQLYIGIALPARSLPPAQPEAAAEEDRGTPSSQQAALPPKPGAKPPPPARFRAGVSR
jgi:hypothetical protein